MANVSFLRGTQTQLEALGSYLEGAFYLTTDSDRLYYAQSASELVRLNHSVIVKSSWSEISQITDVHVGDFYYATAENILCTYTTSGQWIQINRNTDTDTSVRTFTNEKTVEEGSIEVELTLTQTTKDATTGGDKANSTSTFNTTITISQADILKAMPLDVDVGAAVKDGIATVTTEGLGSDDEGHGFTIGGRDGISITGSDNAIIIDGTTYDLSSPAGKTTVVLTDSNNVSDTVTFKAGQQLTVEGATAGEITYSHATISVTRDDEFDTQEPNYGGSINIVQDLTVGDNGHVTSYTKKSLKLPAEQDYQITNLAAGTGDSAGDLSLTIKDKSIKGTGKESSKTLTKGLYYKIDNGGNELKIYNTQTLPVYTKTEIDNMVNDVNAMVYKGTVSDAADLKSKESNAELGHTYMIAAAGTYKVSVNGGTVADHYCDVGDLVIANGKESNGALTEIVWDYVPSGDDTDTQYFLATFNTSNADGSEGGVKIRLVSTVNNGQDVGSVTFTDDNIVNVDGVTLSTDANSKSNSKIKISHKMYDPKVTENTTGTSPDVLSQGETFTVVTGVLSEDTSGHITGITTDTFKLPKVVTQISASDNAITLKDTQGNFSSTTVKFEGGRDVGLTTSDNTITIDHDAFTTTTTALTAQDLQYGGSFTTIPSLVVENGHVTAAQPKTLRLPAMVKLTGFDTTLSSVTGGVQVTNKVTDSVSNYSDSFSMTTSTESIALAAAADGSGMTIDLVWGSFAG